MLIGTFTEGDPRVQVVARHSVPASGIRDGGIYNHEHVEQSISDCITELEQEYGAGVHETVVALSGDRLRFRRQSYRLKTGNPSGRKNGIRIKPEHIDRLYQRIQEQFIEHDYDPLHYHEQLFSLDEGGLVQRPVGLSSMMLAGSLVAQFYPTSTIANVRRVVERSGLIVRAVVSAGLASSLAVLNEDEKELGVLLIDLGADMSDLIAWQHGQVQFAGNIALGAHRITRDIAETLRVEPPTAESIKRNFGTVGSEGSPEEDIEYTDFRHTVHTVGTSEVRQIVQPRVEEVLQRLHDFAAENVLIGGLGGGIVLTGGGSRLLGLPQMVSEVFGKPTRLGRPLGFDNLDDQFAFEEATALGMLRWQTKPERYELRRRETQRLTRWVKRWQKRTIKKMDRIFN